MTLYDHEYYSEKNRNLSTIDRNHLKCDVIDGSVLMVLDNQYFSVLF